MKSKKTPISQDDLIAQIESRLQQPDLPSREFVSLTKRLSNLRGWVKQGHYVRSAAAADKENKPQSLVYQYPETYFWYWQTQVRQRVLQGGPIPVNSTLDRAEAAWAHELGLSVPQLRDEIRREAQVHSAEQSQPEVKS